MKKRFITMAMCLMLLTGCGRGGNNAEHPEDTPWNNGFHAIMENDKGWYTNESAADILSLRYTDKESGAQVYLCSRPECMHEGGGSCTATYNDLEPVNTLMYEGDIYFAAYEQDEETAGIALYRAAADGSALDKAADVYKIKFPRDDRCDIGQEPFIIHKGYAYIPFDLSKRSLPGFGGYIDSGLMKVNIYTGETTEIVSDDEGYFSRRVSRLKGCGDYVYFDYTGMKPGGGTYRYNITSGEVSPTVVNDEIYTVLSGVTPDRVYVSTANENFCLRIESYDSETFEYIGIAADTDERNMASCTLFYNDMIFICGDNDISVYRDGERIGGLADCGEADDFEYSDNISYYRYQNYIWKISDNYFYRIRYGDYFFEERIIYYIDRCPLEDIISGEGEFEEVVRVMDERGRTILLGGYTGEVYYEDPKEEAEENEP